MDIESLFLYFEINLINGTNVMTKSFNCLNNMSKYTFTKEGEIERKKK